MLPRLNKVEKAVFQVVHCVGSEGRSLYRLVAARAVGNMPMHGVLKEFLKRQAWVIVESDPLVDPLVDGGEHADGDQVGNVLTFFKQLRK